MINRQELELPMYGASFYGPKDIRAIDVEPLKFDCVL